MLLFEALFAMCFRWEGSSDRHAQKTAKFSLLEHIEDVLETASFISGSIQIHVIMDIATDFYTLLWSLFQKCWDFFEPQQSRSQFG